MLFMYETNLKLTFTLISTSSGSSGEHNNSKRNDID